MWLTGNKDKDKLRLDALPQVEDLPEGGGAFRGPGEQRERERELKRHGQPPTPTPTPTPLLQTATIKTNK